MWVFALYELLRTWRGRTAELVGWARELSEAEDEAAAVARKRAAIQQRAPDDAEADRRWQVFEQVASTPGFVEELQSATNRMERAFRDVEAVRLWLAKHEVPRRRGAFASAVGYGRIDMESGAISWQVDLGDHEVAQLNRRDLADAVRASADPNPRILPLAIQELIRPRPRACYGVTRVTVVLDDGAEFSGVEVAWAAEVVRVTGHRSTPFDVRRIVGARVDDAPGAQDADDSLPFLSRAARAPRRWASMESPATRVQ